MLFGGHVGGDEGIVAHHANGIRRGLGFDADFMKLAEQRVEVGGIASGDVEVAAGHRSGDDKRAGFDAVGDDAVLRAVQFAHALYANRGRAGAFDLGAHFVEQVGEVRDFGLARAILQNGLAIGESCGHQQVFGAGNGDLVEDDFARP